jgi:protoporphyrinogen oxidase
MPLKEIAIVGAGIAGLTTAYSLLRNARPDAPPFGVTVYEAEEVPGGQARAFDIDGVTVEHGSHVFFNYYRTILDLIEELRADPELAPRIPALSRVVGWTIVDAEGRRATLRQSNGWLPAPFNVAPSIFEIPWLTLVERLRICIASLRLIAVPYARFAELDQKTAFELGRELGYSERGLATWNAASLGLTNLFVAEQSGAVFAAKHKVLIGVPDGLSYYLPAGNLSDLFANPMRTKIEKLGARVRLGAQVVKLERPDGAARTRVSLRTSAGEDQVEADHVIVAVRPADAKKLLPWVNAPWTELEPVTPVITMVLKLSGRIAQSADDREIGCSREHWVFSVVTDLSRFWPEFQGDKTVLRCEIGHADMLPRGADTEDGVLVDMVKRDLDRLFPEARTMKIEWAKMHRESRQLYTSWVRGQWSKKPAERDVGQGIFLAGDWTTKGTIGMEASANSGVEAANHVRCLHGMDPIPFRDIPL